jgi:transposase-like protein
MTGGQMMVVLIVAIVMIASIIKSRHGGGGSRRRSSGLPVTADDSEARRLREEVKLLKERLQVLERITVEKENSLSREIEELRERP